MEQSSFSATSRRNADKNLRAILLAGVGGSLAFHMAAIAGVTHVWKPVAAIDEPMDITMVDVDPEKPPEQPIPKPTPVAAIVKTPVKIEPKPAAVEPVPIIKVPATLEPKPAPAKPVPIVKVPATLEPKPAAPKLAPIVKTAASPDNLIDRILPKQVTKTAPRSSVAPQPTAVTPPAFQDQLFRSTPQPAGTNKAPRPQQTSPQPQIANNAGTSDNQSGLVGTPSGGGGGLAGKLSNNPNPGGSGGNAGNDGDFGAVAPSKIGATGGGDGIGSASNQSGLAGNSSGGGGKLARGLGGGSDILTGTGGNDGEFGTVTPSKIGAADGSDGIGSGSNQSGLAGNSSGGGGRLTRGFGGGSGGGSGGGNGSGSGGGNGSGSGIGGGGGDGDFGTVTQGNTARTARKGVGTEFGSPGSPPSGGDGGVFGLQCIKRCEISGLVDLEDRDGGKDKLRIAIAIDPKGNVTSATIAKSSGNATIDRVIINGVKQMQFSPPGKVVKRVVKANILL